MVQSQATESQHDTTRTETRKQMQGNPGQMHAARNNVWVANSSESQSSRMCISTVEWLAPVPAENARSTDGNRSLDASPRHQIKPCMYGMESVLIQNSHYASMQF